MDLRPSDRMAELLENAKRAGQAHIFRYWHELSETSRQSLLDQTVEIDFNLVNSLYRELVLAKPGDRSAPLEQAEVLSLSHQRGHPDEMREKGRIGERALREGKVAALLVAGGQGSRLGFNGPKGAFPIGTVTGKSLFQLHAEKLLATARRYQTSIPWYIMTSETNHQETHKYFEKHHNFGYRADEIFFFEQGMMPAVDDRGKIILDDRDRIFMNPDGHGGIITAMSKSGALKDMRRRGIEQAYYFQVDNVLLNICDPLFIGWHLAESAEMSAKVCAKRDAYEKMGVIGNRNGRLTVIEYSDMTNEDQEARNPDGSLRYNSGNLAIHLCKLDFLEHEAGKGRHLPWHVAHKAVPFLSEEGWYIEPEQPNAYKFETFIFDALGDAKRCVIMEVDRHEEFSAIKNGSGIDSPETAMRDLTYLYAGWLEQCGVALERNPDGRPKAKIEISPLFALDVEELRRKIELPLKVQSELYLG